MSGAVIRKRAPRAWALWVASRPAQLLLVVTVYALGVVVAVARGAPLKERSLLAGLVVLLPTAAGIHYTNEYADHDTDALTERTPFSGGSGALQATGLPRRLMSTAAVAALTAGVGLAGAALAVGLLPARAVAILVGSALVGVQYSVGPLALARRGLGELANAALGGVALPCYGAAVVGGLGRAVVLAALPFALLVFVNLLETGWPDRRADADVGKDTLAVRWPSRRLRRRHRRGVRDTARTHRGRSRAHPRRHPVAGHAGDATGDAGLRIGGRPVHPARGAAPGRRRDGAGRGPSVAGLESAGVRLIRRRQRGHTAVFK